MRPAKRPAKSTGKAEGRPGCACIPAHAVHAIGSAARQKKYPVDLEPFTFSRQMDQASPLLFEMCCNSQSFASVTLIKRKAAGTDVQRPGIPADRLQGRAGDRRRLGQRRCREGEVQVHLSRRGDPGQAADAGRHAGRCGAGNWKRNMPRREAMTAHRRDQRGRYGAKAWTYPLLRWQADGLWRTTRRPDAGRYQ